MSSSKVFFVLAAVLALSSANVFLHNPRGSNNKGGQDDDQEVQNPQRLFASWNHRAGGYHSAPKMYYYEESLLTVEWTADQGCGPDSPNNCEFILQYMCDEWLRDGTTSQTIPATMAADQNTQYGRHESYMYYSNCQQRERNMGLYVGDSFDMMVNGRPETGDYRTAEYTRQTCLTNVPCTVRRYGYECPEERDYYPYWHPTPWRDIAVFVDDVNAPHPDPAQALQGKTICDFYRLSSGNLVNYGWCDGRPSANNRADCEASNQNQAAGVWNNGEGAHGIPPPECLETPSNRANHLGNNVTGQANRYVWRVPKIGALPSESATQPLSWDIYSKYQHCAMRIRYNVTTNDYPRWTTDHDANSRPQDPLFEPILRSEPYIPVQCPDTTQTNCYRNLSLTTRSDMLGVVFQDRSFEFEIRPRPRTVLNRIHNLNVVGRRGNIVQTFPSVEYDFVPNVLRMYTNEWVHPQWTGSDNNAANQAGEGLDRSDRSNMVQIADMRDNYPIRFSDQTLFPSEYQAVRHAFADLLPSACDSRARLIASNNNNDNAIDEDVRNCGKLNPSMSAYFDGDLQKMRTAGTFYYMSTRNNNFSNRGQKGVIIVEDCTAGADCSVVSDRITYIPGDRYYDARGFGSSTEESSQATTGISVVIGLALNLL